MPDYITNFASEQNLLDAANNVSPFFPANESRLNHQFELPTSVPPPFDLPGVAEYMPPPVTRGPQFANVVTMRPITTNNQPTGGEQKNTPPIAPKLLANIIKEKESSDNYTAVNPKSTASGAYQYTDSTWNNYGGYPRAALAPPSVQDQRFMHDVVTRLQEYGGDPYKAIAAHYLPALANDPEKWMKPFKVHGKTVKPVIDYVRYVVKDTPLEKGLNEYLAQQNG